MFFVLTVFKIMESEHGQTIYQCRAYHWTCVAHSYTDVIAVVVWIIFPLGQYTIFIAADRKSVATNLLDNVY